MSEPEAVGFLKGLCQDFEKLYDFWRNSNLQNLQLTSVGIAIAQSNYKAKTGQATDLPIWIKS